MPFIEYAARNFNRSSIRLIVQANEILDNYQAQGYVLTLRQLYYKFVTLNIFANTDQNYKRLGKVMNDARLAGLVDWDAMEDRMRELADLPHWNDPRHIIDSVAAGYREELWRRQPVRVEVWIEKDALAGVFSRICRELDVPLMTCRGYQSQSSMWQASQRYERYLANDQEVVILHFGDHDPSGIDMTRDIQERLEIFQVDVDVRRIALNMDQVRQYNPPPNPAKITDSRFASYVSAYGRQSWELDALEPTVLADLVRVNVASLRDEDVWREDLAIQNVNKGLLRLVSQKWDKVATFVARKGRR